MKRFLVAFLLLDQFFILSSSAQAGGVKISINLGSSCSPTPLYCAPVVYSTCVPQPVYCTPQPVYSAPVVYNSCPPIIYNSCPKKIIYESCKPRYRAVSWYESPTRLVVVKSEISRYDPEYFQAERPTWHQLDRDWAKDLRQEIVTFDQFEKYLKDNIAKASTENYNEFRNGFIAGYGINGEAAFDKYFQQARGSL